MANKRILYAIQQVGFAPLGSTTFISAHGVQSMGITTNYNLQQIFEQGQLAVYENIEQIPDVEITVEKVLDGYPLLWHLATRGSTLGTLIGRSNTKCIVGTAVFDDTLSSCSGNPIAQMTSSGSFVSSLQYSFPNDGSFTESVTLISNDKVWKTSAFTYTGAFLGNNDVPLALTSGTGGVQQRQDMVFTYPAGLGLDSNSQVNAGPGSSKATVLPPDIPGISSSGTNNRTAGDFDCHLKEINVSCDLGREAIFELGRRAPYHRFVTFPVEVSCDITVTAHTGDLVSATENGILANGENLTARTIKIASTEGTFINLGAANKLSSISYTGGDTGGGNVEITFSYRTYNDLTVSHPQDPSGL